MVLGISCDATLQQVFVPVDRTILQTEGDDSSAFTIFHQQVEGEVFNEVVAVVFEGLAIEGVEQGVASTVSNAATPGGLFWLNKGF